MSKTDTNELNISADTQAIADKSKVLIKIGKNGLPEVDPEFLTKVVGADKADVLAEASKIYSSLVPGVGLAFGELATAAAKKNPDLKKIELEIPLTGKDTLSGSWTRSYETSAAPGSSEKVTKYGRLSIGVEHYNSGNVGDLKKVKSHLAELAMKALG